MADYERVTQDIREGFPRIAANKGDKSVEIIMKEMLAVFAVACEQNSVDMASSRQLFTVEGVAWLTASRRVTPRRRSLIRSWC